MSFLLGAMALAVVAAERALTGKAGAGDGPRSTRGLHIPLGRWKVVASGFVATVVGLSVLVPVAVLGFWAIRGVVRGSTRGAAVVGHIGSLLEPALNTAVVSIVAAVAAVAVVVPVAYLTVRHRSRVGAASYALVVAGFALPGLALALGLGFWTVATPVHETLLLLVFAYVVHFGAQALRAAQVAVAGVPRKMDEAARALGAGWLRRARTIDLPLMTPGLLAGGGLVLLSAMKELPATLLLAPTGFDTLARKIWSSTQDGFLADASLASLLLLAVSGVLTWVLVIRRAHLLD
jgi:iron(III) transport system permease protein